jgi:DNA-binding PadR family transcriptional regulator
MRPGRSRFNPHNEHSPGDRPQRRPGPGGDAEGRPGPRGRGGPRGQHPFGPDGPPWVGRRMRRGDIRTAMLSALQDGPGHGYELMNRLSERSGGRWRPSPGSVYPLLQALQDEGLVTAVETDGKRVFSLTEAGQAAAAERAAAGGAELSFDGDDTHHNLRAAVMQLMAAAKMIGVNGSPEVMAKAEAIVTDARRKLYQLLAEA